MRKRIFQSLIVASMAIFMFPMCAQSSAKQVESGSVISCIDTEYLTERTIRIAEGAKPRLFAGSTDMSNIMKHSATKAVNESVSETVTMAAVIPEPEPEIYLSEEDIRLIATVTMAEAEGECEEGKRLVIDTILNRMESGRFPNTASGVIYQKSQFSCMTDGRINVCYVKDDIYQLVVEEMYQRLNYDVVYFRGGRYSSSGSPMFKVGGHYFSSF